MLAQIFVSNFRPVCDAVLNQLTMGGTLSLTSARTKWLFLAPPAAFFWGCMLTLLLAICVYFLLGEKWFSSGALLLQLAGIFLALWQLIELRAQLGVGGLLSLFQAWRKNFPRHQRLEPPLHVNENIFFQDSISAQSWPGKGGDTEEQIKRLWMFVELLRKETDSIEHVVAQNQRMTAQEFEALSAKVDGQIGKVRRQVTEAVVPSPFPALFGLWLVALSTAMQLVLVFYGSP
ncbi:MAG: hypothetical protein Q7V16_08680 [Hydrogenophaga sp.]|nr:hypothetical protein [Hydrogenophaga sp.]MDP1782329.1 hypothetical protein [Hydrogenophaga sp.]